MDEPELDGLGEQLGVLEGAEGQGVDYVVQEGLALSLVHCVQHYLLLSLLFLHGDPE